MTIDSSTADSTPSSPSAPPRVVRAVLTARGVETRYTRVGCGPTVVMPQVGSCDIERDDCALALATRFRVVAPEIPSIVEATRPDAFAAWLRDVLDCIGVECAHVVAPPALAGQVRGFARTDALRVLRVVIRDEGAPPDAIVRALGKERGAGND